MTYLKINDTLYPAAFRMRTQDSDWDGRGSMGITLGWTYEQAAQTFVDGLEWYQVNQTVSYADADGQTITPEPEITDRSEYEIAGSITDNRNGTVTVKMGKALPKDTAKALTGETELTVREAEQLRGQMESVYALAVPTMTADEAIEHRALCQAWTAGKHESGEVYTAGGQVWQCIQGYDNAVYPDIVPGNSSWGTFHKPYHGTSPETALAWVQPTGAHDMYLAGEYMIWTDGGVYKCLSGTAYSPEEYAGAWEKVE